MKIRNTFAVCMGLAMVTLITTAALACPPGPPVRPPEPVCSEGMITVTPAEWVDEVPQITHEEHRHYIDAVINYSCPTVTWPKHYYWQGWQLKSFGPITFTYDKSNDPNKCHRPTGSSLGVPSRLMNEFNSDNPEWLNAIGTVVTPGFWGPWTLGKCHGSGQCEQRTVVDQEAQPGYWIPPVCRDPIVTKEYIPYDGCRGWSVTEIVYTEGQETGRSIVDGGAWSMPYDLESAQSYGLLIEEDEGCLYKKGFTPITTNDCTGWTLILQVEEGTVPDILTASGSWTKDNKLESASVVVTFSYLDQTFEEVVFTFSEPAECYYCELVPIYRMVALVDYDAPDWYWGKDARNGSCWVIMHEDGTFPSVERQADICSVCSHPDFIYRADKIVVDDYVYYDCEGRIIYPDPEWSSEWFRTDYREICDHRQPSCIVKPTD